MVEWTLNRLCYTVTCAPRRLAHEDARLESRAPGQ